MAKTKKKNYELDAVQFDPAALSAAQLPLPDGVMSAADATNALVVPVPFGEIPPDDVWYVIGFGVVIPLHAGDWIVTDPNSTSNSTLGREFLTPEVFNTKYEAPS